MASQIRPLAIVTGASTGIGFELARECRDNGFDLLICADEPGIEEAAAKLRQAGGEVEAVQADLSGKDGVEKLWQAVRGRKVDALLANAGRGLGRGFLDQDADDWMRVVNTNITGTLLLIQKVGARDEGGGCGPHPRSPARSRGSCPAPTRPSITASRRFSTASPSRSATSSRTAA